MQAHQKKMVLEARLHMLIKKHRVLDEHIEKIRLSPSQDLISLQKLKKQKLVIKDSIHKIRTLLTPDILA